jgi:hypothetical protein
MFVPSIGVNEMEDFVPPVETILDKRAKHAMVLVDAVEERTNMTILIEKTLNKLRGLRGGLHILAFTQKESRSGLADRLGAAQFDPVRGLDATGHRDERVQFTSFAPSLSTVVALSAPHDWHRQIHYK